MKKMGFHFIIVAVLLSSCSSNRWFSGSWEGTGYQIDGNTWAVVLQSENIDSILITYPSLSCGGRWILVEKTKNHLLFKEKIEYGTFRCDQGVEVHVNKLEKDEIEVLYFLRSYEPDKPVANAILTRIDETMQPKTFY